MLQGKKNIMGTGTKKQIYVGEYLDLREEVTGE